MIEEQKLKTEQEVAYLAGSLFGFLFDPTDVGGIFLRNIRRFLPDYTAKLHRRHQSSPPKDN
jgi:hypothetical protein